MRGDEIDRRLPDLCTQIRSWMNGNDEDDDDDDDDDDAQATATAAVDVTTMT